jgi:hypothetical protein
MAAVTPDSIIKADVGRYHLYLAKFAATVDNADTWASGITGIVFWLATQADSNTTQASAGVGATLSGSTFTLAAGEDNTAIHLAVVATGA